MQTTRFDRTVHGGETTIFPMVQGNPYRKKRLLYGLPPNSTVRFGAGCRLDVFYLTVRCGAVPCVFFCQASYGAVPCGFVEGKIVRCGAMRWNRTEPHRTVGKIEPCKVGSLRVLQQEPIGGNRQYIIINRTIVYSPGCDISACIE